MPVESGRLCLASDRTDQPGSDVALRRVPRREGERWRLRAGACRRRGHEEHEGEHERPHGDDRRARIGLPGAPGGERDAHGDERVLQAGAGA
jgi:hypothetical protein